MSELTVVVVSFNSAATIEACLDSVRRHGPSGTKVVVVDNASRDDTLARVRRRFPEVEVLANAENRGFARANNQALAQVATPHVLFLNPDCVVEADSLGRMVEALATRAEVGAVGPRTLNPDRTPQLSYGPDLRPLAEWRQRARVRAVKRRDPGTLREVDAETQREHEPDWLSGSCLMARVRALRGAGGFDEGFFLYEEDADLCLRLRRAGFRLLFLPSAVVVHGLGHSAAQDAAAANVAYHASHLRYYAKHNGAWLTRGLRLWLLASAAWNGLLGLLGSPQRRRAAVALARIALGATAERTPRDAGL